MTAPRRRLSRRALIATASLAAAPVFPAVATSAGDEVERRLAAEQAAWDELRRALVIASKAEDALFAIDESEASAADCEVWAQAARAEADDAQDRHDLARLSLYSTAPASAAAAIALIDRIVERERDMHGTSEEVLAALSQVVTALRSRRPFSGKAAEHG